ncbi:MAG: hypothetical protein ACUVS2_03985 [Candidatus Flexifilum sp.]
MKLIRGLIIGIGVGALIGAALVIAFSPSTGKQFRTALQHEYRQTLADARAAAARRRSELEAQYKRLTAL